MCFLNYCSGALERVAADQPKVILSGVHRRPNSVFSVSTLQAFPRIGSNAKKD
jgi:hypothetical protein